MTVCRVGAYIGLRFVNWL